MIEIKEVKTKKQRKQFVIFPTQLYKNNKNYVHPFYSDEMAVFKKNYYYNDQSKSVFYLAYDNGKVVGRISGIIQYASNEKHHQKRVRFTRFDSIDDQNVANLLFDAVTRWAKANGMNEIVGPLGYSDLEREGLLIEGFDYLSTISEQYNYPYYQKLIENYGFIKEIDWVERRLFSPKELDPRLEYISSRMMAKYNLKYGTTKNIKEFLNRYGEAFFEILDKTYDGLYQTVPITEPVKKNLMKNFSLILNNNYVLVIVDENDKVVCFGLCFPSLAKEVSRCKGKLNPFAIIRILKTVKHPKALELALIGVLPEYANKGISTAILDCLMKMMYNNHEIEYAETNLNLETNNSVQNQWKHFENIQHKRRRSYIKQIK